MARDLDDKSLEFQKDEMDVPEWQRETQDGGAFGNLFDVDVTEEDEQLALCDVTLGHRRLLVEAVRRVCGHTLNKTGRREVYFRDVASRVCLTGIMRWEGGEELGRFLMQKVVHFEDGVVLEMGCGAVPLPSMAVAMAGARKCVLTDGCEQVLEMAQRNIQRNLQHFAPSTEIVHRRLIWGDEKDLHGVLAECTELHWIIAGDVVYSENGTAAFFKTVASILRTFPRAKLLLSYVVRGVGDNRILEMARGAGLRKTTFPSELEVDMAMHSPVQFALFMKGRSERRTVRCVKCCDALASVLVRQGDALCVACHVNHIETKFRSLFKTRGAIQPGDRILIEGSGTAEALSGLDLLLLYRHPDCDSVRRGKTYFGLTIFQDATSSDAVVEKRILQRHGAASKDVEFHTAKWEAIDWNERHPELDETSRQVLEKTHRRRFLVHQAQRLGCNVFMSLETSTALTENLLAASCSGGGFGVPYGLQLCDRRYLSSNGVTLVRLLQELSAADLAYYCHFKGYETTVSQLPRDVTSVQSLTAQFVHSLHETYPSGVSSILRTGSKLQTSDGDNVARCLICDEAVEDKDLSYCYACEMHDVLSSNPCCDGIVRSSTPPDFSCSHNYSQAQEDQQQTELTSAIQKQFPP